MGGVRKQLGVSTLKISLQLSKITIIKGVKSMKGAVIYARYSSDKQNEQSIEGQLRICNQYAESNGLTILDTYIDRAMTGTNDNRPALQQMLSDCAKPVPWDIVLVYAIDRFGRNSIEIAVNKQKLKKNNKTLISATQRTSENIDGSRNLDGILLENVYIGLAEYYSAELSQKVSRGMMENRRKGLYCGGNVFYGYYAVKQKIHIHKQQAKTVLYIFQQYAAGKIVKEIIADLTAQGILRKGKPFAPNTIYNMLKTERYIGIYKYKGEIYPDIYPAIIPKPLFDKVQMITQRNKLGSRSTQVELLLKNKLYCGYCGKSIQGESGTSATNAVKYYYYKCMGRKKRTNNCDKQSIPKEKLEDTVISCLVSLLNTETISKMADAILQLHSKRLHDQSVIKLLSDERAELQRALNNLMKAIEQGIITATTKSRIEEPEIQIANLDDKIIIEQCKLQAQITREQVIEYLTHTIKLSPQYLINTLIQKIIVFDDKLEIYHNYCNIMPPTSPVNPRNYTKDKSSNLLQLVAPFKT